MNPTLFSEIQRLFERTYAAVGINLEDCLIDRRRCGQLSRLAGASARELSELARTFLRSADGQLHVGIYYSRWLIEQLERHDPRSGLNDANIRSLAAFVEEINHALHAALSFQRGVRAIGSEEYARNLELQAQVDTYLVLLLFVAFFRKAQRVSRTGPALAALPSVRAARPARVQRSEPARALPRNDATRPDVHPLPRHDQRPAAAGGNPRLPRARLPGEEGSTFSPCPRPASPRTTRRTDLRGKGEKRLFTATGIG